MAITVACLTNPAMKRYRVIAEAMAEGIYRCGDKATLWHVGSPHFHADVGVMYGWKRHRELEQYPRYVYADLGYWSRDTHYRLTANSWGPESYVRAGLDSSRFAQLGLAIKPWRKPGGEVIVAGSSPKAAADHGLPYMAWERQAVARLTAVGVPVMYRPKPTDQHARPIPGCGYDQRPISEALDSCSGWVTHHSNSAVDALLAGVPVHCQMGAAAAMSVPIEQMDNPPLVQGRKSFLHDVAWLQWTLDEMRSGAAWTHLKERGLVC